MRGGFGCSPCCDPCPPCEQECVEPHTGDPFETVYTLFALGEEVGNPSDGTLTASGDVDESDPYDGMPGSGPWNQSVAGAFEFNPNVTRYPCTIRVSFWRSNFVLGPSPVPPPTAEPTNTRIRVSATQGTILVGDGPFPDEIAEGDYRDYGPIPLVSGTGDQSDDPRLGSGTVSIRPKCRNAIFAVSGRVDWDQQKRQHVVYGKIRECYDTPDPENPDVTSCDEFCDGDPPPDVVYLTISGLSDATVSAISAFNATYAIDAYGREYGICNQYLSRLDFQDCSGASNSLGPVGFGIFAIVNIGNNAGVYANPRSGLSLVCFTNLNGLCYMVAIWCDGFDGEVCSETSGTGIAELYELPISGTTITKTFSWTLSP